MAEESSGRCTTDVPLTDSASKQLSAAVVCSGENGAKTSTDAAGNEADETERSVALSNTQDDDDGEENDNKGQEEDDEDLLFPGFVPKAFYCLTQTSKPRYWCLKLLQWPYPFNKFSRVRFSRLLLNVVLQVFRLNMNTGRRISILFEG